jgi:hypothetical protein
MERRCLPKGDPDATRRKAATVPEPATGEGRCWTALLQAALDQVGQDQRSQATIENELGLIHRDQGNCEKAHTYHIKANEHFPNNPVTLYFLGVSETPLDKKDQAILHMNLAAASAVFLVETNK